HRVHVRIPPGADLSAADQLGADGRDDRPCRRLSDLEGAWGGVRRGGALTGWGVSRPIPGSIAVFFLVIEVAFFGANLVKVAHGGWFPLVVGAVVYTLLSTWKQGRALLASRLRERMYPFERFMRDITERPPTRVDGT